MIQKMASELKKERKEKGDKRKINVKKAYLFHNKLSLKMYFIHIIKMQ